MRLGTVNSPIDSRHAMTGGYAAADWDSIIRATPSIMMYAPAEGRPEFEEAPSRNTSVEPEVYPPPTTRQE